LLNVQQSFYRESRTLFDDLVHDIDISDEVPVRIDTEIRPQGWKISIWFFRSSNRERLQNLSNDQENLRSLLKSLAIPFEEGEKFTYPTRFAYTEPLDQLQPTIQELIDKIARAQ
jgi:hypothetical protein